jgi:hypothetical protein
MSNLINMKEYKFTTRLVNMSETKEEKQTYSEDEIKKYIFTRLSILAQNTLQQCKCYTTRCAAISILSDYEDILHIIAHKMYQNVINKYLEVNDIKDLYTDKCVYKVYLFRFIPEFEDLQFNVDCCPVHLEIDIRELKQEKSRIKDILESYNSDSRHGPPELGLKEVIQTTEKYNELLCYGEVSIDVLVSKRKDVLMTIKELLSTEEEYISYLNKLNRIKKDIRRCKNRIVILENSRKELSSQINK